MVDIQMQFESSKWVSFQMQQGCNICAHGSEPQHALEKMALYPHMYSQYIEKLKSRHKKEAQWSWGLSPSCGCWLTGFILDSSYKMEEMPSLGKHFLGIWSRQNNWIISGTVNKTGKMSHVDSTWTSPTLSSLLTSYLIMKSPKIPFLAILVCSTTLGLNVTLAKVLVCPMTVEGGGDTSPVEIKPQYYRFSPLP